MADVLSKQDVQDVIEVIKQLYLEDRIPWICGYSGGKDSTAIVQLVWMALQEIPWLMKLHNYPEAKMLTVEENMARALSIKWSEYDLAKAVSY